MVALRVKTKQQLKDKINFNKTHQHVPQSELSLCFEEMLCLLKC